MSLLAAREAKHISDLSKAVSERVFFTRLNNVQSNAREVNENVGDLLPKAWQAVSAHRKSCWNLYAIAIDPHCSPKVLVWLNFYFLHSLVTRRARFEVLKSLFKEFKDWGPLFTANGCSEQADEALRRLILLRKVQQQSDTQSTWAIENALAEAGEEAVQTFNRYHPKYELGLIEYLEGLRCLSPSKHAILAQYWSLQGEKGKAREQVARTLIILERHLNKEVNSTHKVRAIMRCYRLVWRANRSCRRCADNEESALRVLQWLNGLKKVQFFEESEFEQFTTVSALYAIDGQQYSSRRRWDRKKLESIINGYKGSDGEVQVWIADVLKGNRRPQER